MLCMHAYMHACHAYYACTLRMRAMHACTPRILRTHAHIQYTCTRRRTQKPKTLDQNQAQTTEAPPPAGLGGRFAPPICGPGLISVECLRLLRAWAHACVLRACMHPCGVCMICMTCKVVQNCFLQLYVHSAHCTRAPARTKRAEAHDHSHIYIQSQTSPASCGFVWLRMDSWRRSRACARSLGMDMRKRSWASYAWARARAACTVCVQGTQACICMHMYACMYMHAYVCMHVYACMYMHAYA